MKSYLTTVETAKESINDIDIKPEEKEHVLIILGRTTSFLETCLKNGTFTYKEVENYARDVEPYCEKLIEYASEA